MGLGGVEEGETVVGMYFMRGVYFQKQKKETAIFLTNNNLFKKSQITKFLNELNSKHKSNILCKGPVCLKSCIVLAECVISMVL